MKKQRNGSAAKVLKPINAESADAALAAAREEYLGQERRHGLIVSKSQTLATVAGLVLAAFAASPTATLSKGWILWTPYLLATASLLIGLWVLVSKEFHRIHFETVVSDDEMAKEPAIVVGCLAKTYMDAVDQSEGPIKTLLLALDLSVYLLMAAILTSVGLHLYEKL